MYKTHIPVRFVRTKTSRPDVKCKQFYESMRFILFVYKCMGLLAIEGLRSKHGGDTRFTWRSIYSVVYIPSIVMPAVLTVILVCHIVTREKGQAQAITDLATCIFTFTIVLTLIRFSMRWGKLLHEIETLEVLLPPIENYKKMATLIKSFTIFQLIMVFVDFTMFTVFTWLLLSGCPALFGPNGQLKSYYLFVFKWFYQFVPFSYLSAIVLQIISIQKTFLWNFNDVLITVLSVYLTSRFKTFNRILLQKQNMSKKFSPSWSTLQVHYTRIARLVAIVDDSISPMILASYASNLMYIFKQIFHIINNLKGPSFTIIDLTQCGQQQSHNTETFLFIAFSTLQVLTRTALVSFLAAKLHATSREPLNVLHTAPASAYDNDMQRLMDQVYYSKVCLTGCNFFSVTRSMILGMVATLITYEVVMFQF